MNNQWQSDEYDSINESIDLNKLNKCPVEVGDYFYRVRPNETVPDRLEVVEIKTDSAGHYFITAKYIYHTIGPNQVRVFSDIIFKDTNWVIEKRGVKHV